jgi:hypothetical protein
VGRRDRIRPNLPLLPIAALANGWAKESESRTEGEKGKETEEERVRGLKRERTKERED